MEYRVVIPFDIKSMAVKYAKELQKNREFQLPGIAVIAYKDEERLTWEDHDVDWIR